jgi:hypothetical protein
VVERGQCTFLEKVLAVQSLGAVGVVVLNVLEPDNIFLMVHSIGLALSVLWWQWVV